MITSTSAKLSSKALLWERPIDPKAHYDSLSSMLKRIAATQVPSFSCSCVPAASKGACQHVPKVNFPKKDEPHVPSLNFPRVTSKTVQQRLPPFFDSANFLKNPGKTPGQLWGVFLFGDHTFVWLSFLSPFQTTNKKIASNTAPPMRQPQPNPSTSKQDELRLEGPSPEAPRPRSPEARFELLKAHHHRQLGTQRLELRQARQEGEAWNWPKAVDPGLGGRGAGSGGSLQGMVGGK